MVQMMFQEQLQYFNRKLSEIIDQEIRNRPDKILFDALNYVKETGGKRLRPLICFLSTEAVGGSRDDSLWTAIAIELIHNASLIHDDVIDENCMRRRSPSSFTKYGEKKAIVIGDFLFGLASEIISRHEAPKIVSLVSKTVSNVSMGQYLEFSLRRSQEVTEQSYMEVAELKTASTFMASAEAGAILGGGSKSEIKNLLNYGKNLGIAFQIQDDILDIFGDPAKTGKPIGLDLKNGERTLLIIHTLNHSNHSEKKYIRDILDEKEISNSDIDRVREIFINSGSIDYAIQSSNEILSKAKNCIDGLKESEAKKKLFFLADSTAKRIESCFC